MAIVSYIIPLMLIIHRLMNSPAGKNEAYQPTVIEQTANIISHGVRVMLNNTVEPDLHNSHLGT